MDECEADSIVDRHWQTLVNSIKAGAVDEDIEAIIEAERRREEPRDIVMDVLMRRRAAIYGNIDVDDDRFDNRREYG